MTMLEAKHVALHGNMTVAGMNTREIAPLRDGCELHLHHETGGVYVHRDGVTTFLSSSVVAAVELLAKPEFLNTSNDTCSKPRGNLTNPLVAQADQDEKANAAARAEQLEKGAKNLADEVLAELRDGEPKSARKLRATKRS